MKRAIRPIIRKSLISSIAASVLVMSHSMATGPMSTNYAIPWDVIDGAGDLSMSASYVLTDSIAQSTAVGASFAASYVADGGFHTPLDTDLDEFKDFIDNCPTISNPGQEDADGDFVGDLCETQVVAGLTDINGNGFADVAVLVPGVNTHVHIRDGMDGALISDIDFGTDPVTAMTVVNDINGGGAPEIALLGTRPDDNVRVQLKDSVTGATVNNIFYGAVYSAVNMAVLPDTDENAADELLVVGADDTGGVRAQARDAFDDGVTSTTYFGNKVPPQDVLTIPDISTNSEPEVLVHGRVNISNQGRAQMRDSDSRNLLRNFFFGTDYVPIQLVTTQDMSGDGIPDLAQLARRDDTGQIRVQIKRTDTGATMANAFTGSIDVPITVVGIGDANSDGTADVALLVERPDRTARVAVRDGTNGNQVKNIFFAAVSNPLAMALIDDLDGSGDPELAVLGDDGAGTRRVQIRDSISGDQINTIDFP